MTKIDIISGFLGAGKTTLIKKLIQDSLHNEKVVLIENEFGEIGIDGGFLEDAGIEIREMNSGCICCSLVGDFSVALQKVLDQYHPDRIIIEPSGVGKLSDVQRAVEEINDDSIIINSLTTVVDAQKCKMYMKNFGEFFNNQLAYANVIILSRTQHLSDEKIASVVHEIKHQNAQAHIVTTPWEKLQGEDIVSTMENVDSLEKKLLEEQDVCPTCGHHHEHEEHHHHEQEHHHHEHEEHHHHEQEHHHHEHEEHHHHNHEDCTCGHDHHHADDVFTSWGNETPRKYTRIELEQILANLSLKETYGEVLRAKGMLENVDGSWMYFDFVPEEYEIREGNPTYTGRFCVIGSNLNEDNLNVLFQVV